MRNKFLSLIAFLGVLLFLSSLLFDTLSLGQTERVLTDFGLSFIEITWLLIILLLGWGMITREIEWRTIYLLLSKPISRGSILYGKFVGCAFVLLLMIILETIFVVGILSMSGFFPEMLFFLAVVGIFLKLLSILALILFFSTCVSPTIALFMTIASYIIGHSGYLMLEYAIGSADVAFLQLARFILALFPNLEALNLKNYVATDAIIDINNYLIAFGMALVYTTVITFLAAKIFERRSFDAV
jgi:ABC-type transport system involved in multi-copper enzyme maturation permease subunit